MSRIFLGNPFRRKVTISAIVMVVVLCMLPVISATTLAASKQTSSISQVSVKSFKGLRFKFALKGQQPPTDAMCRAQTGTPCYSPQEMRRAYNVAPLVNAGYGGKGQTIVIIDSFGSPTIQADLHTFDQGYGLPDPKLTILSPLGTVPFDPSNSDMVGWAFETTLDVEWSHAMAPDANIVLMTSPIDETEGVQGMPQFLYLEKYALDHHLGKIISQSWGATENTLFTPAGEQVFDQFNSFYKHAAQENVTVFASTGDSGSSNVELDGTTIYPFPTVGYPASSPWVTAVGGTSLYADTNGRYESETVWDEVAKMAGAGGGGISQVFSEPDYQRANLPKSDQELLGGHRGIPDISYNADPLTAILVYISIPVPSIPPGFYTIGGTSEGSPQWAGIIADADQLAGRPLGFLNDALYQIGNSSDASESFHDITVGNNGYNGVPGYNATPGWDAASGWGTPKAANLVSELIEQITG
jgi:subtilase family serine protease